MIRKIPAFSKKAGILFDYMGTFCYNIWLKNAGFSALLEEIK